MIDYTKLSVDEIRRLLVESGKFTDEQANEIKGKTNLVLAHKELYAPIENNDTSELEDDFLDEEMFEEIPDNQDELVDSLLEDDSDQLPSFPMLGSTEWQNYVLGLLSEDEIINGYPLCAGLRRLTENLLGNIIYSGPDEIFIRDSEVTVAYKLKIEWKLNEIIQFGDRFPVREFVGLASASISNISGDYAKYIAACAETRAESRALRKALFLKVAAYEELDSEAPKTEFTPSIDVDGTQLILIKNLCTRLNLNYSKVIGNENELTKDAARLKIKLLNDYQGGFAEIPEDIKL